MLQMNTLDRIRSFGGGGSGQLDRSNQYPPASLAEWPLCLLHLPLSRQHALHERRLLCHAETGLRGRADGVHGGSVWVGARGSLDEARRDVRVLAVLPWDAAEVDAKLLTHLLGELLLKVC